LLINQLSASGAIACSAETQHSYSAIATTSATKKSLAARDKNNPFARVIAYIKKTTDAINDVFGVAGNFADNIFG
jgi:hypothetical protein